MPVSSRHESIPSLVRDRPELVAELLAMLHVEVPQSTRARISDIALHEAAPIEHFADVVVLLALEDRPVLGVIVEAQLRRDDRKLYAWPQYAMNARARHKCPFLVLVATPSSAVARWAGQPIDVGNGTVFRQHIIGPETVPKVTNAARATREPDHAMLSVFIHARRNTPAARLIASATLRGISRLDPERALLYSMMVRNMLPPALRKELEKMPDLRQYLSAAEQRTYDRAEARGEARGRIQGKVEGKAEGRAEGKAEAVLKILTKRRLTTTPLQRRQIEECTDLETLDRWFDQALTAASVDELFGNAKRNGHRAPRRNGTRTARRA
jgi:hypothetical protein